MSNPVTIRSHDDHRPAAFTFSELGGTIFLIVLFALFATTVMHYAKVASDIPSSLWDPRRFLSSLWFSAVIFSCQIASSSLAHRFVPLRTFMSGVAHVVIQTISALIAFWLAQNVETIVTGSCQIPPNLTAIMYVVTFALSLIGNAIFYVVYYRDLATRARQSALQSELSMLRAQINPHFLFNTLNSVAALVRINPDEAETMIERLAELFRYSLRSSSMPLVALEDEVMSAELYMGIEKARFGEQIRFSVTVPSVVRSAAVPSLILQPLVENAVKHGVSPSPATLSVRIAATVEQSTVVVRVEDNGKGFPTLEQNHIFGSGTGLTNVRNRLFLLFPGRAEISIEKNAVVLRFPFLDINEVARNPKVVI